MDFTIGLNIGDDGKILIHIRIPEDEGFTISEAERFRDLLDKQITVARSMSEGEENMRRFPKLTPARPCSCPFADLSDLAPGRLVAMIEFV